MEKDKKIYLFEEMPVSKAVMKLALPTMLSSIVMVLYNLADTWFVGMLNDPIQTAAVTLAGPVLLAFNAVNNLFGVGTSSMMGRALGRKEYDTVKRTSAFGFWASVLSGILFAVLCTVFKPGLMSMLGAASDNIEATADYMFWTVTLGAAPSILNVVMAYLVRTEGSSMHASIGTMSGCLLNIILDPIFVLPWGFNMGAAGAGCATFISNCVACAYFFALLFVKRENTFVCLNPKMAKPRKDIVLGVCIVGIPASIQNLLNVLSMTLLNNFTAAYGSTAVAAMGISHKLYQIPMQVTMGMAQGIMPLVSYNYGSRNYKRARKTVSHTIKIAMIGLVIATVGYYVFADVLVRLFIENAEIVAYGTKFLRAKCIALPFLCLDFIGVNVYQAFGKGHLSLFFAILRKVILEIPLLFILERVYPLYGLAYSQPIGEFILAIAASVVMINMFKRLESEPRPGKALTGADE